MHELLAPVGNSEMLEAAIDGGADAVYLAGPNYGARAAKANFSLIELKAAIERAHLMGLSVYLTVNTLIHESERAACAAYLDEVVALSVDAIIAQDLFVIDYLTRHYPTLPLHGSTQMSIYNLNGLKNAAKLGLKRVVLARELTLDQLAPLFQDDLPEIEVFAHGAMCYAYSGACLLSSFNGGRSGNRGQCAQSCRLKYKMAETAGHLLSMRDLSTIDGIGQLTKYPISTFKIEGRLRSADYVYHTVLAYRKALDGVSRDQLTPYIEKMKLAFNRSYSSGYLWSAQRRLNNEQAGNLGELIGTVVGSAGKYHQKIKLTRRMQVGDAVKFGEGEQLKGTEIFNIYKGRSKVAVGQAGDIININYRKAVAPGSKVYRTRSAALSEMRQAPTAKKQLPITINFSVSADYLIKLTVSCLTSGRTIVQTSRAEAAVKKPIERATIAKQLAKLGDTPYRLINCDIVLATSCYISLKTINQLRRSALNALSAARIKRPARPKKMAYPSAQLTAQDNPRIICKVTSQAQYDVLKHYDVALYGDKIRQPNWQAAQHSWRPFSDYQNLMVKRQMVAGIAQIDSAKQNVLDEHSQIYNVAAYDRLRRLGVIDITLSPEIKRDEALTLAKQRPFRIFAYGKLPLMYAATCPQKEAGQNCSTCSKVFSVNSDQLADMVVYCRDQILAYYTAKPVVNSWAWRSEQALPLLLSFTDEDAATTNRVVTALLNNESL